MALRLAQLRQLQMSRATKDVNVGVKEEMSRYLY